MKKFLVTTTAILSLVAGTPVYAAESALSGGAHVRFDAGQSVLTGRGQVMTTGRVGGMQTTTLPQGGGQGFLMDNGNGTSTLIGPGSVTTVPTPN